MEELGRFPEQRNHTKSTDSAASLDQLSSWLQRCDSEHADCCNSRVVSSEHRPARLVDIDRSPGMFCVVPSSAVDPSERYVTLSHRWRKTQSPQLTVDNEQFLRQGMPISELPKVFRDAILVARHIGVHLLWIDCLCIIQQGDNYKDWDFESSQMNVIYQNAYCSFSANDATDGNDATDEGLLFDRDPQLFARLNIQSSSGDGSGKEDWTSISKDIWRTEVSNSSLNNRGWFFQERALAPRVVHFCRREIFWECRKASLCESFPTATPSSSVFDLDRFVSLRQRPTEFWENCDWRGDPRFPLEDLPYEVWDDIVKEYTRRQFTIPSDKLVAISGVARSFKKYIQDIYVAGMWRKRLAAELGWWIYPSRSRYTWGAEPSYYAPSFSWTSVKGQVNSSGPFALGILVDVECVTMESGPGNPSGDEVICEDVFDVPPQASLFQLRVSGVLSPARLRCVKTWELIVAASSIESTEGPQNKHTAVVLSPFFDFEVPFERREAFESEPIYMMHWRYGPEPGEYDMSKADMHFMLLMPTDRARHQFRRVGFAHAEGDEARLLHESSDEDVLPECFDKETKKHTVYMV